MFNKIKENINLTRASLCLEKIYTGNYNQNTGTYETTKQYELNGEYNFTVSSYEVYQIEY